MSARDRWSHRRSTLNAITEIILGVVLLVLVVGFWMSLWVPPLAGP